MASRRNRYNPYTQQYLAPIQGASSVYQPIYDPSETDRMAQILQQRQQRYDVGQQRLSEAQSQIGGMQTYSPDLLNERLGEFTGNIQGMVEDQYGGDWGLAANDITSAIAKERANPLYKLIDYQNKQAAAFEKAKLETPEGKFIDINDPRQNLQQAYEASQAGQDPYSMLEAKFAQIPDRAKLVEQQFADITPDQYTQLIADLPKGTDYSDIEGLKRTIQTKFISNENLRNKVAAGVDAMLQNDPTWELQHGESAREEATKYALSQIADKAFYQESAKLLDLSKKASNNDVVNIGGKYYPTITSDKTTSSKYSDTVKGYDFDKYDVLENISNLDTEDIEKETGKFKSVEKSLKSLTEGKIDDIDQGVLDEKQLKQYLKLQSLSKKTAIGSDGKQKQLIKNVNSKEHKEYYEGIVDLQKSLGKSIQKNKPTESSIKFYNKNKELIDEFNDYKNLYPEAFQNLDFKKGLNQFAGLRDKQNTTASKVITFGNDNTLRNNISKSVIDNKTLESIYAYNQKDNKYEPINKKETDQLTDIDVKGITGDKNTNINDYNVIGLNTKDFSIELEHNDKSGKKLHVYPTYRTAQLGEVAKSTLEKIDSNQGAVNYEFNDVYNLPQNFRTISMKVYNPYTNSLENKTVPISIDNLKKIVDDQGNVKREFGQKYIKQYLNENNLWSDDTNTQNIFGNKIIGILKEDYTDEDFNK